jgi:ABC-type cobalt transport system substrate-binding protein
MREFLKLLYRPDAGEIEKLVITQASQLRAVIVTAERSAELERQTCDSKAPAE